MLDKSGGEWKESTKWSEVEQSLQENNGRFELPFARKSGEGGDVAKDWLKEENGWTKDGRQEDEKKGIGDEGRSENGHLVRSHTWRLGKKAVLSNGRRWVKDSQLGMEHQRRRLEV